MNLSDFSQGLKQMRFSGVLLLVISLLSFHNVSAQQTTVEFSADTVESDMQGGERTGKLYVGKDRVRTEFNMNGQTLIQIIDLDAQEALMINPQEKSYIRSQAGAGALPSGPAAKGGSPCAGMENITCKQVGEEKVNGRPAVKWVFESQAAGQSGSMTIWLDEQRGVPLRQIMPDGSSMEMLLIGPEKVAGRSAELWEVTTTGADGEARKSYQFYDPELKMNIREEAESGFFRELRNIKVGKQPDALFKVPPGYSEVSMPAAPEE